MLLQKIGFVFQTSSWCNSEKVLILWSVDYHSFWLDRPLFHGFPVALHDG